MDKDNTLGKGCPEAGEDKTRYTPILSKDFVDVKRRKVPEKAQGLPLSEMKVKTGSNTDEGVAIAIMESNKIQPSTNSTLPTGTTADHTDGGGDPYNSEDDDEKTPIPMLKPNQYQVRKSVARSLMDAALMMANISQLRTLVELGPDRANLYSLLLGLTVFSLVCQVVFALLMFMLLIRESDAAAKKDYLEHLQMLETKGLPKEVAQNMRKAVGQEFETFQHKIYTSRLNYVSIFLVFIISVVNMLITGFGINDKN